MVLEGKFLVCGASNISVLSSLIDFPFFKTSSIFFTLTLCTIDCILNPHLFTHLTDASLQETHTWMTKSKSEYRKNSKNWDTLYYYRDCPTNGIVGFYSAILRSKDADRITNRVDTDKTAPWGAVWFGSALFVQTYLSQYFKLLRYYFIALQGASKKREPFLKML